MIWLLGLAHCAYGQVDAAPSLESSESAVVIQAAPASELPRFLTNERPIRRSIVNEFLQSQNASRGTNSLAPGEIQITSASYDARFSADGVLAGSARIGFHNRTQSHVVFPMSGLRLAITKIKWKDRPEPVRFGLRHDGRLVLVVPESGELEFEWSAPASKIGQDSCEFDIGILKAIRTNFALTSPQSWKPIFANHDLSESRPEEGDFIRHRIQIGPSQSLRFRLENTLSPTVESPPYWIRMSHRYDVGRQGTDIIAELEIETTGRPVKSLPLRIDSPLQLISAKLGDQPLKWTPGTDATPHAMELQFDPPLIDGGRKVRLEARAVLPMGPVISLPRIHPPSSHLREAELDLNIAPPLELAGIELDEARMMDTGAVLSPRGGESRRIRLVSPAANIRCAFHLPEFRGKNRYLAKVTAGETSWELDALCQILIEAGERFDLSAPIPSGWIVDSIESLPTGAIENWSVAAEAEQQKLSLRLTKALTPKSSLTIRMTAHMPRVGGESHSSKVFRLNQFDALKTEEGFLQLIPGPGIRVDVDAAIPQLNPTSLKPADLEVMKLAPTGTVYPLAPGIDFQINPVVAGAEFRVASASRVLLESDRSVNQHRLTITPQRQQFERLLIHIQPATGKEVIFDLENAQSNSVSTKLVASDSQSDLWEVRFSESISEEVILAATEISAIPTKARLRTLRCEGAAAHDSTLRVFGDEQRRWEVRTTGVEPLHVPFDSRAPLAELGAFRFSQVDNPLIEVVRKEDASRSSSVWSPIDHRVTFADDERLHFHSSSYYLESHEPFEAEFLLPAAPRGVQVQRNGRSMDSFQLTGSNLTIPLPASRTGHLIEIQVAVAPAKKVLGMAFIQWQGAIPKFPTLSQSWNIWTPPGAATANFDPSLQLRSAFSLVKREPANNGETIEPTPLAERFATMEAQDGAPSYDQSQLQLTGWKLTSIRGDLASNRRMIQYSDAFWRFLGWCTFAVSFFVTLFQLSESRRRYKLAAITITGIAAAAVVAPEPVSFILSGALLGGVTGWLARSLQNFVKAVSIPVRRSENASSARTVTTAAVVAAVMLGSVSHVGPALCQGDSKLGKPTGAPRMRSVIDPVDQAGNPVGDFVYVSPEFFEELALQGPAQTSEPSLLTQARYRVARAGNLVGDSLILGVELDYFAASDAATAPLWIDTKATPITNREIFVDGQRILLKENSDSRPPQIELQGRGSHTIKLNLQIPLKTENDLSVALFPALALAKQQLEIEADSNLAWQLNGRQIDHDGVNSTATIPIPPLSELKLGVRRVGPAVTSPEPSVSHDAWITLSPGSLAVEHRVQIGPESSAASIRFELDEGFQLDSIIDENRQAIAPISLGSRRFRAILSSPAGEAAEIRILCSRKSALYLSQVSETGIRFPGAQITKTRVAISAGSDYSLQAESRAGVSELSTSEFMRSWPQGKSAPRLALQVDAGKSWVVAVRPAAKATTASLQTEYLFRSAEIQLQWEAEVISGGEPQPFYVLHAPPNFTVDSVSVHEAAVNRLVRFAQSGSKRITLFMRTASLEPRKILVKGSIPTGSGAPILLPTLTLEDANIASQRVRLFRGDDVQVEIKQSKGLKAIDLTSQTSPIASAIQPKHGRMLADFEVLDPSLPWEATVLTSPNSPQLTHESIARFKPGQSKWRLVQDFKLSIQNGLADEFVLDLPEGIQEPIEISPSQPFQIVDGDSQLRRLVIRPTQPWKDSRTLQISADYSPDGGAGELAFSPLRLIRSTLRQGWIAAAKQAGVGAFVWNGIGSEEQSQPPNEADSADFVWFQERDAQARVLLERGVDETKAAAARLDGVVKMDSDRFTAALTWYWGGASAQESTLHVPQGVRVLSARVVGSSVRLSEVSDGIWRLSSTLGSAPPILEVICQGPCQAEAPLPLPILEGAKIEESLITLHGSREWRASETRHSPLLSAWTAYEARLRLLDKTKRDSQTNLPTLGQYESLIWRRRWLEHWDAARASSPQLGGNTAPQSKWLEQADVDRERFAADLAASAAEAATLDSPLDISPSLEAILRTESALIEPQYFFAEGKHPTIAISRRSLFSQLLESAQAKLQAAHGLMPVLIGGAILSIVLLAAPGLRLGFLRAAPLLGWIALGCIWWSWFTPSWFGPLMAAMAIFCFVGAFVKHWSKKSFRGSAA